jgi:hypothetical protein
MTVLNELLCRLEFDETSTEEADNIEEKEGLAMKREMKVLVVIWGDNVWTI